MQQGEIAEALGITQQGVAYLERRALRHFRQNWEALFGTPVPGSGEDVPT